MAGRTKLPCTIRMRCPIDDLVLGEWDLSMTHVRAAVGATWPSHRRQRHATEPSYGGRKGQMVLICNECREVIDKCDTSEMSWAGRFGAARDAHELDAHQPSLFSESA